MSYSESELADIEAFKKCADEMMKIEKVEGVQYRNASFLNKLVHTIKCSDGVRRRDIADYLDFLFPPGYDQWLAQYTASATDRTIVLNEKYEHLNFTVTYKS
jgi:hypothetical protein